MRYIYSIIGAIILLISGTQSAFAQKETTITRTILGCTLGKSTLDSVTIRLQELGAEFEPTNPTTPRAAGLLVTGGVTFASARPRILFIFIDKKLALINIIFLSKDDADRINRNLSLKYKNWEDTTTYKEEGGAVQDPRTFLLHTYTFAEDYKKDFQYSTLSYGDKTLLSKSAKIASEEL